MKKQDGPYKKSFRCPDERREFKSHGHLDILNFADGTSIGCAIFQPGWRWSNDVKPLAGTDSCQAAHVGYCVSGMMMIRMDNGDEFKIEPGDAFSFGPGHDAWVIGMSPCVLIDVAGYANYARLRAA